MCLRIVYATGEEWIVFKKIVSTVNRIGNTADSQQKMSSLIQRVFVFFVLAIFTTSIFADAIITTKISSSMISSALEHMDLNMTEDLDKCSDCLTKNNNCGACDAGCTNMLNALPNSYSPKVVITVNHFLAESPQSYQSNTGPPDPFPPRSST